MEIMKQEDEAALPKFDPTRWVGNPEIAADNAIKALRARQGPREPQEPQDRKALPALKVLKVMMVLQDRKDLRVQLALKVQRVRAALKVRAALCKSTTINNKALQQLSAKIAPRFSFNTQKI